MLGEPRCTAPAAVRPDGRATLVVPAGAAVLRRADEPEGCGEGGPAGSGRGGAHLHPGKDAQVCGVRRHARSGSGAVRQFAGAPCTRNEAADCLPARPLHHPPLSMQNERPRCCQQVCGMAWRSGGAAAPEDAREHHGCLRHPCSKLVACCRRCFVP